ncbi:MAG: hypothetical protein S4CHLAM7_06410 [Chlamydiae bacterium]|nr:hypothetical protein [Chlamydiota bacterium]
MTYAARLGILFVFILFASRVSPGILIENHWYSFFWSLGVAAINAIIRTVFVVNQWKSSWILMGFWAVVINVILFWILSLGALSWLGITTNSFSSVILAIIIVSIVSTICNHFIGFKRSDIDK